MDQKQYLIDSILSNLRLNGEKLEFTFVEPCGAIVKMSKTGKWCSIVDILQTSAVEQLNNPSLYNLVSLFGSIATYFRQVVIYRYRSGLN